MKNHVKQYKNLIIKQYLLWDIDRYVQFISVQVSGFGLIRCGGKHQWVFGRRQLTVITPNTEQRVCFTGLLCHHTYQLKALPIIDDQTAIQTERLSGISNDVFIDIDAMQVDITTQSIKAPVKNTQALSIQPIVMSDTAQPPTITINFKHLSI